MYAIVKTGGKQYKVAPGDKINVEKLEGQVGDKVNLTAICVVDGKNVVADPAEAEKTPVVATIVEQFRDKKKIIFKFEKRKNYSRKKGHRQQLTRIAIESIGSEKAAAPKAKATKAAKKETKASADAE